MSSESASRDPSVRLAIGPSANSSSSILGHGGRAGRRAGRRGRERGRGRSPVRQILIGAHFDSIPGTPGADDNASAVSALLAAARAIGSRQGLCYVAFDGEECGFVGSRAFVEELGPQPPQQVHILEMVGYASRQPDSQRNPVPMIQAPTVGDFLGLVGTFGSWRLLDHVLAAADCHALAVQGLYLPEVPLETIEQISQHLLRSDHAPFWRAGIPALMWTDTAEFRNPHYHRPTDLPQTLDYEFLAGVTRLLIHAVLSGLAGGM